MINCVNSVVKPLSMDGLIEMAGCVQVGAGIAIFALNGLVTPTPVGVAVGIALIAGAVFVKSCKDSPEFQVAPTLKNSEHFGRDTVGGTDDNAVDINEFIQNSNERFLARLSKATGEDPNKVKSFRRRVKTPPALRASTKTEHTNWIDSDVHEGNEPDGHKHGYKSMREYRRSVDQPSGQFDFLLKKFTTFKEIKEAGLFNVLDEGKLTFDYVTPVKEEVTQLEEGKKSEALATSVEDKKREVALTCSVMCELGSGFKKASLLGKFGIVLLQTLAVFCVCPFTAIYDACLFIKDKYQEQK